MPAALPRLFAIVMLALGICMSAHAGDIAVARPTSTVAGTSKIGVVEAGIEYHSLSADLGEWKGGYVRGIWFASPKSVVNYELVDTRRFGAHGRYASIGLTQTLDDRWYASAALGAGNGAFFFPDWRVDVAVNRKWGADRSLITTLGFTQYNAPDGHVDRTALLGLTWYAPGKWVLEGGWRPNRSSPGAVHSTSGYLAGTWGEEGRQYVSLRHERGREAYQTIGADILLVDFPSRVSSLTWRRWLTSRCGFNLRAERYDNPSYRRNGMELGGFCGF
ncbi:MAG: YaiO family outer membrane beta-barrel protein [Thermomonas sp.]